MLRDMSTEQAYWDSVQECQEMVGELILRTEQWITRLPEMERLLKLQERAGARLSNVHPDIPGVVLRRERARVLYAGRCARFSKIWEEKGAFAQEAQDRFDDLSTVLIRDEVERRKAQVNWADPVSILKALQSVAQRLEEFWQSRPGQSAAPATAAGSGTGQNNDSGPATRTPRESRQRDEDGLADDRVPSAAPGSVTSGEVKAAPAPDTPSATESQALAGTPEDRLSHFMHENPDTTLADIKYSAAVYTSDFQDWRKGKLSPQSVMSQRIEDVLLGRRAFTKKPHKRKAD